MEEKKEKIRRAKSPKGERSQRMMSFRLDNDLTELLDSVANKGRTINNALRAWFYANSPSEAAREIDPASTSPEDNQP